MTEILPRAEKELAAIREMAIEEDPVLQKAAMNINLRAGEFLLKSKLNPKSAAGETVGLKKTDLVEIQQKDNKKKEKELGRLKYKNSKLYDITLEEKVFRNRDCVEYLKNEVKKSANRMLHVKSGVSITDAIYRVEEQKPLPEIKPSFLPKLANVKSETNCTFDKRNSINLVCYPQNDIKVSLPSTI